MRFLQEMKWSIVYICLLGLIGIAFISSVILVRSLSLSSIWPLAILLGCSFLNVAEALVERWRVSSFLKKHEGLKVKLSCFKFVVKMNDRIALVVILILYAFVSSTRMAFYSLVFFPMAEMLFMNIVGCWKRKKETDMRLFIKIVDQLHLISFLTLT